MHGIHTQDNVAHLRSPPTAFWQLKYLYPNIYLKLVEEAKRYRLDIVGISNVVLFHNAVATSAAVTASISPS